ncbi:MAG: hypothetical protein H0V12_06325 [Chloroflexi bacterium]|nr:hypothetical protein [Chloroflexota bacterium]
MPLFRSIGAWTMERGVDGLTAAVLVSIIPARPLILGIGLFYELFSRLDVRDALSTRTHWTLAMAATLVLIVGVAAVMLRPA